MRAVVVAVVRLVVAVVALGSVACAPVRHVVQLEQDDRALVIRDVTMIDGTGRAPRVHVDVVVVDGRVQVIRPAGAPLDKTLSARVIDGRGQTLLPGFVDAHVHIANDGAPKGTPGLNVEENLERLVRVGVTTAFDMGSRADEMRTLDDRVADGTIAGPHLRHTHFVITARGGYPLALVDEVAPLPAWLVALALPQVGSVEDIDRVLDEQDEIGVDYVKIMVDRVPAGEPMLDAALLRALIVEAKRRGHVTVVHAGHVDDAVVAAGAGATMLAHLPRRGRFSAAQLQVIKDSGVVVIATAAMWEKTIEVLEGRFQPSPADTILVPDAMLKAVVEAGTPPPTATTSPMLATLRDDLVAHTDDRAENLKALIAAGVPVIVGTDSPVAGTWAGSSYEAELRALLAAGLTPMQLIVAMTSQASRAIGGGFGIIHEGALADLVLVDGDPLEDPSRLFRPKRVFVAGREVTALSPLPPSAPLVLRAPPVIVPVIPPVDEPPAPPADVDELR